jgi:hypothetical protein
MSKYELYKNAEKFVKIGLPMKQIKYQLLNFGFELNLINEVLDEILGKNGMDQNTYNGIHKGFFLKAQIVFIVFFLIFILGLYYFSIKIMFNGHVIISNQFFDEE